jgi:hypothetical protein
MPARQTHLRPSSRVRRDRSAVRTRRQASSRVHLPHPATPVRRVSRVPKATQAHAIRAATAIACTTRFTCRLHRIRPVAAAREGLDRFQCYGTERAGTGIQGVLVCQAMLDTLEASR